MQENKNLHEKENSQGRIINTNMETDHQNTFQPTENQYSGLGGEEFQPEKPDLTGKCLPLLSDKFAG